MKLSATTDQEGRYRLTVPAAQVKGQTVELRVTFDGLQTGSATIRLTPGTITQDFSLTVGFTG